MVLPPGPELDHLVAAFLAKGFIAHGEDLVYEQGVVKLHAASGREVMCYDMQYCPRKQP